MDPLEEPVVYSDVPEGERKVDVLEDPTVKVQTDVRSGGEREEEVDPEVGPVRREVDPQGHLEMVKEEEVGEVPGDPGVDVVNRGDAEVEYDVGPVGEGEEKVDPEVPETERGTNPSREPRDET